MFKYPYQFFHNNEKALEFFILNNVLQPNKICVCGQFSILTINKRNRKDVILYRCNNRYYRKRKSIFCGTVFENVKIELFETLFFSVSF
jgi:hypothetical protein